MPKTVFHLATSYSIFLRILASKAVSHWNYGLSGGCPAKGRVGALG